MREPDPFAECRPGGSCPDCNARVYHCERCNAEVEEPGEVCDECSEKECDWCGEPAEGRYCSRGCRLASESDRA